MAKQRGIVLDVIALDCSARHLQVAREWVGSEMQISLVQGDAFRLPLRDSGVDIVLASLFLHHFRPAQMVEILRAWERVSWVANDLVRHPLPMAFFRMTGPLFARSYLTRLDGAASIRRAYTVPEMRAIVQPEFPQAQVRSHFPYRLSVMRNKADE